MENNQILKIETNINKRGAGRMRHILKIFFAAFAFAAFYFGAVSTARADVSSCDNFSGVHMRRVTYYENLNPSASDLRASVVSDQWVVRLKGWLYYEEGKKQKNEKVIIYNHGHNDSRGEPCALAKYFVQKGFVVFAPLRRGHYAKTPSPIPDNWQKISSTGVFTDDYVDTCLATVSCSCTVVGVTLPPIFCSYNSLEVNYIRDQVADVREQIRYIKDHAAIDADGSSTTGKLADAAFITILGHSYGGSLTTFANAELDSQNVAISVSGAELSWGDDEPRWESELRWAMNDQQRPIYFLQPKNGRTLEPMKTLFGIAIDKKYRSQAAIFPPTDWDPLKIDDETGELEPEFKQAHENFIGKTAEINGWGKSVKEFIERYPK